VSAAAATSETVTARAATADLFLPIPHRFAQNRGMADEPGSNSPKGLVKWALTPPQSYVVYVIGLLLVYSVSYYAGTLNPKKGAGPPLPSVAVPRD
jgi:hypothetical protein